MIGWMNKFKRWWQGGGTFDQPPSKHLSTEPPTISPTSRVERVILTDGIVRTLFGEFAEHRHSERGDEEIGWMLLGLRQEGEVIVLAALPAGTQRDAGAAHIRFNSDAQALASRIVRQQDKRLQIVGIVHTHPGSLRSPSDGDFQGDRHWVKQLRRGEGVFGIGTADARPNEFANPNLQIAGNLSFSWYALGTGDRQYRPLPVQVVRGPDLAVGLHPVWNVIEAFAEPLNKLCRQFAKVQLEVIDEEPSRLLLVKIPLAEPNQQLRLLFNETDVRYYWERDKELIAINPQETQMDRAVYLILAELAKEPTIRTSEIATFVES